MKALIKLQLINIIIISAGVCLMYSCQQKQTTKEKYISITPQKKPNEWRKGLVNKTVSCCKGSPSRFRNLKASPAALKTVQVPVAHNEQVLPMVGELKNLRLAPEVQLKNF